MKRKLVICISGLVVAVVLIILYFWVLNPIQLKIKYVEDRKSSWSGLLIPETEKNSTLPFDNFDNKLPSDNSDDYRCIFVEVNVINRSFFLLNSIQSVVEEVDSREGWRVVALNRGELEEGDYGAERFCKKSISTMALTVYVGDLSSEEEIMEMAERLVVGCNYRFFYNMQWFGNKEKICRFKPPVKMEFYEMEY